jgi:hypothetical protein
MFSKIGTFDFIFFMGGAKMSYSLWERAKIRISILYYRSPWLLYGRWCDWNLWEVAKIGILMEARGYLNSCAGPGKHALPCLTPRPFVPKTSH